LISTKSLSGSTRPDAAEIEQTMLKRLKIVAVVDDDLSTLKATETLLDAHGFGTRVFASAEEFLARRSTTRIDCLLLDIHLGGGMSGIELRHRLTASDSTLPVIFITALEDETICRQALKAGCVAFLRKPFEARQLIAAIEKAAP
jgi:FixJ family two-component response regulator